MTHCRTSSDGGSPLATASITATTAIITIFDFIFPFLSFSETALMLRIISQPRIRQRHNPPPCYVFASEGWFKDNISHRPGVPLHYETPNSQLETGTSRATISRPTATRFCTRRLRTTSSAKPTDHIENTATREPTICRICPRSFQMPQFRFGPKHQADLLPLLYSAHCPTYSRRRLPTRTPLAQSRL